MSDNFDQIPVEMRAYNQWIVWRYEHRPNEKPTKVLYTVATGFRASVSDPSTWTTYDSAVACARAGIGYDGIGFVFNTDPYTGVDLDVKEGAQPSEIQTYTFNKLNSYAELSPSGRGVHIIVKGNVPHGRNSQELGIEIYSTGRFFTMTGNRVNSAPIEDRSPMVLELWHEMGGVFGDNDGTPHVIANPAVVNDDVLIQRICASGRNNAYFNWSAAFDWSEAYRSVLGAACLFSSDETQIRRVILASPLVTNSPAHGRETRHRRVERLWAREYGYASRQGDIERGDAPYRLWSQKWFPGGSRDLYAQVIAQAKESAEAMIASNIARVMENARRARARSTPTVATDDLPVPLYTAGLVKLEHLDVTPPQGVFRDIVAEVCQRTRNPSEVMAMWAILGFVSGAVGRAYVTEEGAGVNNFFILSAGTNTGKTQHWSAIEAIVRVCAPRLLSHILGGSAASPQILAEEAQNMPSMVLRLPDSGGWLAGIVDAKTQIQVNIREALLSIYESANAGASWHIPKSIRTKKENSKSVDEFNMSIALDTTPQYLTNFDLSDFTDGLMSRFIMVYGPETISNLQQPKRSDDLPDRIVTTFDDLYKLSVACSRPTNVGSMAGAMGLPSRMIVTHEPGLNAYLWSLEVEITEAVRDIQNKRLPPHYIAASRVVLNAKRVAAIVAMIEAPGAPVITRAIFDWALKFVMASVTSVVRMFDAGTMGSEESKQEAAVIDYIERTIAARGDKPYVTLSELGKYVDKLAPFARSKMGARFTRQRVLADMFERGVLQRTTLQGTTKPIQVITFADPN
jgi:hypothetical protein